MSGRRWGAARRVLVRALVIAAAAGVAAPVTSAAAQGLLDALFGGYRRPAVSYSPPTQAYAPEPSLFDTLRSTPADPMSPTISGPSTTFCVRTCDGRYFPVPRRAGMSPAQACSAFCPASEARTFSGASIDYAVARDGTRYADLANAYVYRRQIVPGCTCNGRDAFGLARIDVAEDPTLRSGDIVATADGFMVATGRPGAVALTPVADTPHLPASVRQTLADTQVMPPPRVVTVIAVPTATAEGAPRLGVTPILPPRLDRRAQLFN